MTYEPSKDVAINQLILEGVRYDTIASMLNVAKDTVAAVKRREKKTNISFSDKKEYI